MVCGFATYIFQVGVFYLFIFQHVLSDISYQWNTDDLPTSFQLDVSIGIFPVEIYDNYMGLSLSYQRGCVQLVLLSNI